MPRLQQTPGGAGGFAGQAPRDDRSGLIDIRALASVIDAQRSSATPTASASSVVLPSFAASWALQDTRQPPAPAPLSAARAVVPPRAEPDNRPLYAMIVGLSIAIVSLGGYVALREPPTVVMQTAAAAAPAVDDVADEVADTADAAPDPVPAVVSPAPVEAEVAEAPAEPPEAQAITPRPRVRRPGKTPRRPTKGPKAPASQDRPNRSKGAVPIECVLHPESRGCASGDSRDPEPDRRSTAGLPKRPSASQIRSAMAKVKPQAKACGAKHGVGKGKRVRVKLSVVGKSGAITKARAVEEHEGTAVGRCVAGALRKATLPRFSTAQIGIVFGVTL